MAVSSNLDVFLARKRKLVHVEEQMNGVKYRVILKAASCKVKTWFTENKCKHFSCVQYPFTVSYCNYVLFCIDQSHIISVKYIEVLSCTMTKCKINAFHRRQLENIWFH